MVRRKRVREKVAQSGRVPEANEDEQEGLGPGSRGRVEVSSDSCVLEAFMGPMTPEEEPSMGFGHSQAVALKRDRERISKLRAYCEN